MIFHKIEIAQNEECALAHAAPSKKYVSIGGWLK